MSRRIQIKLPIAAKAVLLIAGLGVMSVAANWFCLQQLDHANRLNARITGHIAPARLALSEARAAIESFGIATYKTYVATDAEQIQEYSGIIDGEYRAVKNSLNNVESYFPAASGQVQDIIEKLELAYNVALDLKQAMLTGNHPVAQRIIEYRFDAARDHVGALTYRLINVLGAETRTMRQQVESETDELLRITIAILAGGTAITLLIAFFLTRIFVSRPLNRIIGTMTSMANGDLRITVAGGHRSDEIGAMARAVEVFRNNALALREAEHLRAIEREQAEAEKASALEHVATVFEHDVLGIASAVEQAATELESFSRGMSAVAEEAKRHAGMAASVAGESTAGAAGVAAAIEELSSSIGQISDQVDSASGIVAEAARCSGSAVSNSTALMTTVKDIDQIAAMVTAIASKTNLLALNATIEAARAGDAGRGFAVVAQEVKALAAQTAKALSDIRGKTGSVNDVVTAVQSATSAMSQVMKQVEGISSSIAYSVEQQSMAARKIAESVDGSAERTRQVSCSIAGVSELAGQTGRGAGQVLEAASELSRQAAALAATARNFGNRVRAA